MDILTFSKVISIFKILALIQSALFGVLFFITLCYKFYKEYHQNQQEKILLKIKTLLLNYDSLNNDEIFFLRKHQQDAFLIFFDLEKQNTWHDHAIYSNILNEIFLPHLHDAVYSKDWLARSKAGMILQLKNKYFKIMSPEDEAYLVDLLADSVNIVSINACIAVLFSPTQKTIDYLIDLISQKRRSQYEILKTILKQSAFQVVPLIQNRLSHEKNVYVRAFCYRILRQLPKVEISIPFLNMDLNTKEVDLKLAALSYISYIEMPGYKNYLCSSIQSSNWEERARCAKIIGYTHDSELAKFLEPLLSDEVWWVRYRSAEALMGLGPKGQEILNAQKIEIDKFAYEISQQLLHDFSLNQGKP
jgi:HEAT repeat protein